MQTRILILLGMLAVGCSAVQAQNETQQKMVASANVEGTAEGSPLSGDVRFYETKDGLQAVVEVTGVVSAGKHGIHIHEHGNCEDVGNAAGGHYNPHTVKHGFLPKDGHEGAHSGDMGNIEIDAQGNGTLTIDLPGLTIMGENGIENKAVIIHEKEDDFGQPTGNAGGRIGCGIIEANNEIMGEKADTEPNPAE